MLEVGLYDGSFRNQSFTMGGENNNATPQHFRWVRNKARPITFYTDARLDEAKYFPKRIKKIALLIEPPLVFDTNYYKAYRLRDYYDYILTFNKDFLTYNSLTGSDSQWLYYPLGGSWISPENWAIHEKTKLCSMIVPEERKGAGCALRHYLWHHVTGLFKVDIYGKGFNPMPTKRTALSDYKYSIVIESMRLPGYFSEKIIDCMSQGTVPIYWGASDIGDYFDINGIIQFDNAFDLTDILIEISTNEDDYQQRMEAISNNILSCRKYVCGEDWLYENYPFLFEPKQD